MDRDLEDMKRKVDAIYDMLLASYSKNNGKMELENAIRKAIDDLDKTKRSFKSSQIMEIKAYLMRALERKV